MEPVDSLQHSQMPTTCPYPEPDQSSPCLYKINLNIILPSTHVSSKWSIREAESSRRNIYWSQNNISPE
jgi:hypothetical protein